MSRRTNGYYQKHKKKEVWAGHLYVREYAVSLCFWNFTRDSGSVNWIRIKPSTSIQLFFVFLESLFYPKE